MEKRDWLLFWNYGIVRYCTKLGLENGEQFSGQPSSRWSQFLLMVGRICVCSVQDCRAWRLPWWRGDPTPRRGGQRIRSVFKLFWKWINVSCLRSWFNYDFSVMLRVRILKEVMVKWRESMSLRLLPWVGYRPTLRLPLSVAPWIDAVQLIVGLVFYVWLWVCWWVVVWVYEFLSLVGGWPIGKAKNLRLRSGHQFLFLAFRLWLLCMFAFVLSIQELQVPRFGLLHCWNWLFVSV